MSFVYSIVFKFLSICHIAMCINLWRILTGEEISPVFITKILWNCFPDKSAKLTFCLIPCVKTFCKTALDVEMMTSVNRLILFQSPNSSFLFIPECPNLNCNPNLPTEEGCPRAFDLVFIMDSSGSVQWFNWPKVWNKSKHICLAHDGFLTNCKSKIYMPSLSNLISVLSRLWSLPS